MDTYRHYREREKRLMIGRRGGGAFYRFSPLVKGIPLNNEGKR